MNDTAVKLAVLLIVGTAIGPAWNLTIAELSDATDASATTMFQPDLMIAAWGGRWPMSPWASCSTSPATSQSREPGRHP